MEFGKRLTEMRKQRNMTQDDLAEKFHVTRQAISNWENGKNYPDVEMLIHISNEFNVSLDTMLKGDNDMVRNITKEQLMGKRQNRRTIITVIVTVLIMICIIFTYFILSGVFYVHSSYGNVLSVSKYDKLAGGDDWCINIPEDYNDLLPYFKYEGSKFSKTNIHVKAIFYLDEESIARVEWYPNADQQYFFGEQRFYFLEDYNGIQKVACKIIWNEYNSDKDEVSYIFSSDLTYAEKKEALKYIDTININENNNYPKH
jgi:transcriptional regulator with XRE-family HTH domain